MNSAGRSTTTIRRAARLLFELLLPLHSIDSTPERSRYWRALPLRRAAKLLIAIFLVLSSVGFFADLMNSGAYPLWGVLVLSFAGGTLAVLALLIKLRLPRYSVPASFLMLGLILVVSSLRQQPRMKLSDAARERIVFDAVGIFAAALLGYRFFLGFVSTEGLRHVELQTELSLAQTIQTTLVPPVTYRDRHIEAFGRTVPSEKVGGDLVDLATTDASVVAYLADVSGHGIPAGVLMGMVKTAVRHGLLSDSGLPALLHGVNLVLPAVKEPHMYVTFAGLRFTGACSVEYTLAGHPPILHYRRSTGTVARCEMEQFPLGLFAAAESLSRYVEYATGDLFVAVTDGIVETTNAQDEEFGLESLERLLPALADCPLPEIFDQMLAAVAHHGAQEDDRTMLLVRILP